ncbi:MAG TPA: AIR synthase-related protein [Solirubrobacteraceae bacterium]|nr:AIR synthase-related protein [Solirubrobacteraceae bacterium]
MTSGSSAYRSAGVDYRALDAGKRGALTEALKTSGLIESLGGRALDQSRGEPAFMFQCGGLTLGFVVEGLGTKSLIARQLRDRLGGAGFASVAYDTVAAIVNDLCCVGALPLVVNAYFATGSSSWYQDAEAHQALLDGWRDACQDAGAVWGGGESPSLSDLVSRQDIELAGSAVGVVPEGREPLLGQNLQPGDEIVLVDSSGLHANGASLARKVAGELTHGYATLLPSGREFGQALLDRSLIYVGLVRDLLMGDMDVHYLSHITGHGLLKLMRPRRELTYRIGRLPKVPEVLAFLSSAADLDPPAAYSTLNMGAGFAVYCGASVGEAVVGLADQHGLVAQVAGRVEEGPRRVVLEELGVTYESEELDLGPGDRSR